MLYHYTVGDCFHAHCQSPAATTTNVAMHIHHDCGHHHHHNADEQVADDCTAEHGAPQAPTDSGCPHNDFHDSHSSATLTAGYQHWGAIKAPVAVLDGLIIVACERLGSSEPFACDVAHNYHIRTRGDCYRGLGAFLS